jgi:hypothetical protein
VGAKDVEDDASSVVSSSSAADGGFFNEESFDDFDDASSTVNPLTTTGSSLLLVFGDDVFMNPVDEDEDSIEGRWIGGGGSGCCSLPSADECPLDFETFF